jgi:hypothetical protein
VEPHLLQLIGDQRPGLLPDPRVDGDASEVVHERRAAERKDAGFVHRAPPRRLGGQLRDARGVTRQIGRHQVGEVAHRGERAIERLPLEPQRRARLAGERLLPYRRLCVECEDPFGIVEQAAGHPRIERLAGALTHEAHHALLAPEHALERGIHCESDDPHRQRDLLALRATERALAVPALEPVGE